MTHVRRLREWFVRVALSFLGTPYRWGGDDPTGIDCSGLVVECLISVGLLPDQIDLTANDLLKRYRGKQIDLPTRGCLILFQNERGEARHVGICLDQDLYISASGGSNLVLTTEDATDSNAFVKIRPIPGPSTRLVFADPFKQPAINPTGNKASAGTRSSRT